MKQCFSIIKTACVFVSLLFFVACQKNTQLDSGTSITSTDLQNTVNQWMASQVQAAKGNEKTQLKYLSDNLLTNQVLASPTSDGKRQVLVVPLSDKFVSSSNKGKPITNKLVLVVDKAGKIIFNYVAQFLPSTGNNSVQPPAEVFTKFFTDNTVVPFKMPDGMYTFVGTSNDRPKWGMHFTNNVMDALSRTRMTTPKGNTNVTTNSIDTPGDNENCTAWYWVTTYTMGDETWEFIGITCSGDGGGGGGGGGGAGVDAGDQSLTSVTSLQSWKVVWGTVVNWAVYSNEQLDGQRGASSGKGTFTAITHLTFSPSGGCTFSGTAVTGLTSSTTAKSEVVGTVGWGGTPSDQAIPKTTNTFSFNSISW